ncbi:MAG: hypothetical protein BMS9Abin30_0633 [Gammaproteobacteria bacterium]|nr:MAG: hypothetical protein BMS9Abin30_0633 [Gammaproteobacteria bacterium]
MKYGNYLSPVCILVLLLGLSDPAAIRAQEHDFQPVHWAYSSIFGTGWYQLDGNRSVFVLRMPPRQTLRQSSITDSGERKLGVEINYPVTVGLHSIDDLQEIISPDNFGTISFTPGVGLEIPVNKRWYLRPFANFGWGTEKDSDDSAWIYYAGIKSRYTFPGRKFDWSLLNGIYYAGYTPNSGRAESLAAAQLGVGFRRPLNNATLFGRALDLNWHVIYSFLGEEIDFGLPDGKFDPVKDQFEIGVAVSFRDQPYEFWFFKINYLGLGYQFTPDGRFEAITFSMRSWFKK